MARATDRDADLRLRLAKGDSLCLNEHTINQDDNSTHGNRRLWLTCGGETFAEAVWSDQMLAEERHWPWITQQVEHHRAVVAERLVAELLPDGGEPVSPESADGARK